MTVHSARTAVQFSSCAVNGIVTYIRCSCSSGRGVRCIGVWAAVRQTTGVACELNRFISPPSLCSSCFADVFIYLFLVISSKTNYLNIHRINLYKICTDDKTLAVDEWRKITFSISQGTLLWQPIFCGLNPHLFSLRYIPDTAWDRHIVALEVE